MTRRESLSVQWRVQADKAEHDADAHRAMAHEDYLAGRDDMCHRNEKQAARLQGVADALRSCARQLSAEVVR